ncbi:MULTISPECIES: DUF3147 family protein [Alloalcanivorax]|uniref:DUF3147 family protein n=1 Tax=Alloalcanivorax gelatiniphagus TaxID=1194167 RepID=A0ABY2XHL6_9GAMM|nr:MULTISPECIES: DUF3147 family protein [Alloalcanivorax]ASK36185.1 hypothetical protein CEK62_18245 [Alcanivorax sp. N3-2A]TMW11256.1 DUF3147 family protein [Alloalcanivorax gelatiniphagus]
MPLFVKYLITALLVVVVSEIARHSGRLGALVAALPLVTVLTLIWLHVEGAPSARIVDHAWYTFWYVLPTLPMFLLFPVMMARWGFWPALSCSALLTLVCFLVLVVTMKRFGIDLL